MKHTSIPWYLKPNGPAFDLHRKVDIGEFPKHMILLNMEYIDNQEFLANAKFIIRACNSYYDLLEACKEAIPLLEDEWEGTSEDSSGNITINKLKQVIAKAEGKQ